MDLRCGGPQPICKWVVVKVGSGNPMDDASTMVVASPTQMVMLVLLMCHFCTSEK
jgi:hypothetical protein